MDEHRTTLKQRIERPIAVPAGLCLSSGDTFTVNDQAKCMLAMALGGAGLKKAMTPQVAPACG